MEQCLSAQKLLLSFSPSDNASTTLALQSITKKQISSLENILEYDIQNPVLHKEVLERFHQEYISTYVVQEAFILDKQLVKDPGLITGIAEDINRYKLWQKEWQEKGSLSQGMNQDHSEQSVNSQEKDHDLHAQNKQLRQALIQSENRIMELQNHMTKLQFIIQDQQKIINQSKERLSEPTKPTHPLSNSILGLFFEFDGTLPTEQKKENIHQHNAPIRNFENEPPASVTESPEILRAQGKNSHKRNREPMVFGSELRTQTAPSLFNNTPDLLNQSRKKQQISQSVDSNAVQFGNK